MASLTSTLGALEIGATISTFLFGITTLQAYIYYSRFPGDRWQIKTLVIFVCLLELAHIISVLHSFYTFSILQYGHPEKMFTTSPIGFNLSAILSGCIASVVQVFFANRVRKVTCKAYIAIFCWMLSFLRLIAAAGVALVTFRTNLVNLVENWRWLTTLGWVVGTIVDVLIASLLCYDLTKKRHSSLRNTTKLLDRLIIITIHTALFPSLMTLAVTIAFFIMNDNFIWLAIYVCLARVFSNSLLASLNARTDIRQIDQTIQFVGSSITDGHSSAFKS